MTKQKKSQSGMTLTEVLVAVSVSILIVGAAYLISVTGQKSYSQTQDRIELTQNARIALDRMSREIRQSTEIVTEFPSQEIMFEDGHTTINRYIIYNLNNNNLRRIVRAYYFGSSLPDETEWVVYDSKDKEGHSPNWQNIEDEEMANFISSLQFSGETVVNIDLAASKNGTTFNFATSILPRNL